jgi:hypothetical protein
MRALKSINAVKQFVFPRNDPAYKLAVGQTVLLISGVCGKYGTVSKVILPQDEQKKTFIDTAVEVQTAHELIHFDRFGEACDGKPGFPENVWKIDFRRLKQRDLARRRFVALFVVALF